MSNKVAVITGVSGGLAQEVVLTMLRAHYDVAAINRNADFDFSTFQNEASKNGVQFKAYTADISSEASIAIATEQLLNDFNRIDTLVHLAGISYSGMSWKQSIENWNEVLAINLTGPMLVSKHLIPQMKKQNEGCII
jgi:NAD(P)-dependent dehydrogenase (short-subunit alcohol dehydrogenase family)